MKRRQFILSGLCALVYGCESTQGPSTLPSMGGVWPDVKPRPSTGHTVVPAPSQPKSPVASGGGGGSLQPIPRSTWTRAQPDLSDINPMNGVDRITCHHEGMPDPVYFTDYNTCRDRMELIRSSHRRRGWSDIGYHYVIDRAGRLWEARSIVYQGAHVRDNNEHNVGVMCMGNFDLQQPSEAQLTTLARTVQQIRQFYRVPESRIYTHQEINPTACPGRNMQPRVVAMRARHMFA